MALMEKVGNGRVLSHTICICLFPPPNHHQPVPGCIHIYTPHVVYIYRERETGSSVTLGDVFREPFSAERDIVRRIALMNIVASRSTRWMSLGQHLFEEGASSSEIY